MTYQEWFDDHGKKTNFIIEKLKKNGLNQKEIIEYFRFENMVEAEPHFCLLYKSKQKCHDTENLNCIFCGCPYFRFSSSSSHCSIKSKDGKQILGSDGNRHQDCSNCFVPHREKFIVQNFGYDWFGVMKECNLT